MPKDSIICYHLEGYRGLIYNASDVIRLSNATETSIMLCGKAQPPLVGRGGIEPLPPAPKARPLKDWAIWTLVISHRYRWAMDILTHICSMDLSKLYYVLLTLYKKRS